MPLKFIDLFAGLGGFHMALENLGFECVFASELKEDLRKLYKINFPNTRIEGDITKISPSDIPGHDILCGGFPCQPFSQAGKQQGFKDEKQRGNLFYNICSIIEYHRPKYVLLENVSNLKGHDHGATWKEIQRILDDVLNYDVRDVILSPHQFGFPQHRKRIYIIAVDRTKGGLNENFHFPEPQKIECNINSILDPKDTEYIKIKPETRDQMKIWQDFIDETIAHGEDIPSFPIWAMEFGADYNYDIAPAFQDMNDLIGKKGKLGQTIYGNTKEDCLKQLPIYAQTKKDITFPKWKIKYISQNRAFYEKNKEWLDVWIQKVKELANSHLKMEWNCGKKATPTLTDKIIQFRASGIRVKLPNFSPALNLVGTQIPILPWIKLPKKTVAKDDIPTGRYMTRKEAARLQGMTKLKFGDDNFELSQSRSFEALGNAINVDIVSLIAINLIQHE